MIGVGIGVVAGLATLAILGQLALQDEIALLRSAGRLGSSLSGAFGGGGGGQTVSIPKVALVVVGSFVVATIVARNV